MIRIEIQDLAMIESHFSNLEELTERNLKQTQDAIDVKELDTRPFNVLWTYQREKSQLSQLNQQIGQQTIQIETMEED